MAAIGTGMVFYGLRRIVGGKRYTSFPFGYGNKIKKSVTVERSPEELYNFWRNLNNIPQLVHNIVSVQVVDGVLSRWKLQVPGGVELQWDAEIIVDRKNEMIGWRSSSDSDIANAGYIRFERASAGRGTVVRVAFQYNPPGGKVGAALSSLLGERPGGLVDEALRRFKQILEAGEVPTARDKHIGMEEEVEIASEDSFPASDAPAWTGTTGPTAPRH